MSFRLIESVVFPEMVALRLSHRKSSRASLYPVILALLVWAGAPVSAAAWELSVRGEIEWRYRYISRVGTCDLFGDASWAQSPLNVDANLKSSIGLTGPHKGWVHVEGYSSKGSDAAYGAQRLWLYPTLEVNQAIRVMGDVAMQANLNGPYRVTGPGSGNTGWAQWLWGSDNWATNMHYAGWTMMESRDLVGNVGMTMPVVRAFWARINFPFGTLLIGRRPAGFGVGWVLHEQDVYARSLSLVVPYGPFKVVFSQYLHDNGEHTDPNDQRNERESFQAANSTAGLNPFGVPSATDQNEVMQWNQAVAVTYQAGNLDLGAMLYLMKYNNIHQMRIGSAFGLFSPDRTFYDDANLGLIAAYPPSPPNVLMTWGPTSLFLGDFTSDFGGQGGTATRGVRGDMSFLLGSIYLKYGTGRFFFNGEYDFQYIEVRRRGGRPLSGFPQAWATELGFISGPLRLSAAHFYRSGHDRRRGVFYPAAATGYRTINVYSTGGPARVSGYEYYHDKVQAFLTLWGGGSGPIDPYAFLLGVYGTGNNSFNWAGDCTYSDFSGYASRIDYAVAANLNLFATVIYAHRASATATPQGYFTGFPNQPSERNGTIFPIVFGNPNIQGMDSGRPNVPSTDLGWEFGLGFRWQLLQNLTWNGRFARWQPGRWFKWAYQDASRIFPAPPNQADEWTRYVNPNRAISPIVAMETTLRIDF